MVDINRINEWIAENLDRGISPDDLKSRLGEQGYDPNLVDVFLVKNAVNSTTVQNTNTYTSGQQAFESAPVSTQGQNPVSSEQQKEGQVSSQAASGNASEFEKMGFLDNIKMIFFDPKKFFDIMPRSGGYGEPYGFFLVLTVISTILSYGVNYASWKGLLNTIPSAYQAYFIYVLLGFFIIGLLAPFISALFLNLLFKLFGGKGTYESTFRVLCYVAAVGIVAWIPIVGGLVGLYGAYIAVAGYSKVHQISGGRVLLAILLPIIVLFIIISTLVAYFSYSYIAQMQSDVVLAGTGNPALGVTGNLLKIALN